MGPSRMGPVPHSLSDTVKFNHGYPVRYPCGHLDDTTGLNSITKETRAMLHSLLLQRHDNPRQHQNKIQELLTQLSSEVGSTLRRAPPDDNIDITHWDVF